MYSISNLGLNMPGQNKPIGYWNSVGTSFGFVERSDPNIGDKMTNPGPGTYPQMVDSEGYDRRGGDEETAPNGPAWK